VYPDQRVVRFIDEQCIPVRIHVREQADEWKRLGARYGVEWTPTILFVDASVEERHRIEGFLPVDDFLAQLAFGMARVAFSGGRFDDAERRFRAIVDDYPSTDAAPESLYWAGVSRYKGTNDASALAETARHFRERYQDSSWAKKSSVWGS
jgi:hypothetical protein